VPFALLTGIGGSLPVRIPADVAQTARAAAAFAPASEILYVAPSHAPNRLPSTLGVAWASGFLAVIGAWTVRWRRVRRSPQLEPGVVGLLRPTLVLPEGITEHLTEAQLACEALVERVAALGVEERVGKIDPDRLVVVGVLRYVDVVVVVEEVELDVVEDTGHCSSPPLRRVRCAHSCTEPGRCQVIHSNPGLDRVFRPQLLFA
jgi:hypothetical protein